VFLKKGVVANLLANEERVQAHIPKYQQLDVKLYALLRDDQFSIG
jgi:hypothetical protein